MDELQNRFKVKALGLFGSFVREEQIQGSDIDILVEFSEPTGLFEFIRLKNYLSELLDRPVDLVSKKALKPRIGQNILREVVFV